APVVEPSVPELAVEEGAVWPIFFQRGERLLRCALVLRTEVDADGELRERAVGNLGRAIGGVEHGLRESCVDERVVDLLHVVVIAAEGAVLVFNLGENDRAAGADLQRSELLA